MPQRPYKPGAAPIRRGGRGYAEERSAAEPAGQFLYPDVPMLLQAKLGDELTRPSSSLFGRETAQLPEHPQQVVHRVEEVRRLLLGHDAHHRLHLVGFCNDVLPKHAYLSRGRQQLGGDLPDQCRLAGAVRPKETQDLARLGRERVVSVRPRAPLIPLVDTLDDQRHGFRCWERDLECFVGRAGLGVLCHGNSLPVSFSLESRRGFDPRLGYIAADSSTSGTLPIRLSVFRPKKTPTPQRRGRSGLLPGYLPPGLAGCRQAAPAHRP